MYNRANNSFNTIKIWECNLMYETEELKIIKSFCKLNFNVIKRF